MYSKEEPEYQRSYDEKAFSDDILHEYDAPVVEYEGYHKELPKVLPAWLDETRLVCFVVGFFGLVYMIFNIGYFARMISNPFALNLALFLGLAGFSNIMLFPNVLKYWLVNGYRSSSILKTMNTFMIAFSVLLLVFLCSFPVSGLGLSLILVPAPLIFSLFSRNFIDQSYTGNGAQYQMLDIFDRDINRLAWFSFVLIFCTLVFAFVGLFFGLI